MGGVSGLGPQKDFFVPASQQLSLDPASLVLPSTLPGQRVGVEVNALGAVFSMMSSMNPTMPEEAKKMLNLALLNIFQPNGGVVTTEMNDHAQQIITLMLQQIMKKN